MIARQKRVWILGVEGHLAFRRVCGRACPVATQTTSTQRAKATLGMNVDAQIAQELLSDRGGLRARSHRTSDLVQLIDQPNGVRMCGTYKLKAFLHHSCERARPTRIGCQRRLCTGRFQPRDPNQHDKRSLSLSLWKVTLRFRSTKIRAPTPRPFA